MKRGNTIGKMLERIHKAKPHRNDATGQLYRTITETKTKRKTITLYTLFVSDHNTFLLRPHVFHSSQDVAKSPREWNAWLRKHYTTEPYENDSRPPILKNILDGLDVRTEKQWRVYKIIGWINNDNTQLANPAPRKARHKTKSKR